MKIVYIDGFKIRHEYSMDFGIIHRRTTGGFAPTWYIPKGEIWIERRLRDETDFLVAVDRREEALYDAHPRMNPRRIRAMLRNEFCKTPVPALPSYTKKKYRRYGLRVREVDGGTVRRTLDPLFVIGGHREVYPYVPRGEVWVDHKMNPREIPYHVIHEAIEYKLMRRGVGYDTAHECTHAAEREVRRRDGYGFPSDEDADDRRTPLADLLLRLK